MRTRITSLVIGAMTALLVVAGPVAAGDGKVVITLDVNFAKGSETFTATGDFCPRGSAVSTETTITGRPVFHVDKTLTCKDRSGTLSISLNAVATDTGTQGGWTVTGGTGAYAHATGGGQIVGVFYANGVVDTYTGTITR